MIRRPPRSTLDRSSAASDVYKRQPKNFTFVGFKKNRRKAFKMNISYAWLKDYIAIEPVSYTHLRAHETVLDLVCRLLLEKKKNTVLNNFIILLNQQIPHIS